MEDPEIKAISAITTALNNLNDEQKRNVLLYVTSRYGAAAPTPARPILAPISANAAPFNDTQYEGLGDFFDAANPQTEADRVLVASYWVQVIEGAADFESFPVNKHLKNLGQTVSNITRAIDSLINQMPRLVIQTSKTGNSKQARKKYKVTREGIKRVQSMLSRNGENTDDDK